LCELCELCESRGESRVCWFWGAVRVGIWSFRESCFVDPRRHLSLACLGSTDCRTSDPGSTRTHVPVGVNNGNRGGFGWSPIKRAKVLHAYSGIFMAHLQGLITASWDGQFSMFPVRTSACFNNPAIRCCTRGWMVPLGQIIPLQGAERPGVQPLVTRRAQAIGFIGVVAIIDDFRRDAFAGFAKVGHGGE